MPLIVFHGINVLGVHISLQVIGCGPGSHSETRIFSEADVDGFPNAATTDILVPAILKNR
jgi:hypothetical protein